MTRQDWFDTGLILTILLTVVLVAFLYVESC